MVLPKVETNTGRSGVQTRRQPSSAARGSLPGTVRPAFTAARRMTIVGSPYWMAPEMMNGEDYTEKVDCFSFGIIICELLGRVKADPDYMPRTKDFGVDFGLLGPLVAGDCPRSLFELATLCCSLVPDSRSYICSMTWWWREGKRGFCVGVSL